ncbi:MAG: NADH-quinone oxidoreductase subunit NuoN [Gammaproteobacteria bacterium]|nr:NADH-quinone oxidoreductase subunit NuoN [Gammaproteobacteria bacterium]
MGVDALNLLLPEIVLLTLACVTLLGDIFSTDPHHRTGYWLAQASLLITAVLLAAGYSTDVQYAMSGMFVSDPMSAVLKLVICIIGLFAFFYSREYLGRHQILKGEYFVLGLFAILGMLVLVSANSLLTVYLGLELLSLSLYAMVALHRDSKTASEAAIKYFVLGAIASGMLLYGISILYGVTGSLELGEVAAAIEASEYSTLAVFGLVFVLIGVAFKLGAVPFHMWLPDVYEGAPTSVTLFIGSAPKLAAFAMAIRLFVDGLGPLLTDWQQMLMILSVLSMAAGNVIAISQSNIKRMLAYSTIAHVGFLLLGIVAGTAGGYAGSMFYVITYALMSMGAFAMIIILERRGMEADRLQDFSGLATRNPWLAFLMLILMFSMAGVPPFLGFWAKWFVLREVIQAGFIWIALLAVVFAIIGAFYYLRIVKLMYFDEPLDESEPECSISLRAVISINGLALLLLGLSPGMLMSLCVAAFAV